MFVNKFVLIATLSSAIQAVAETTSYLGPPLEYTVYGPGDSSCIESNIEYTGATISLVPMEEGVLCETDMINGANDTFTVFHSKIEKVECVADKVSYNVYNCMDISCKDCSPDAEASGYVPTPAILDALEDPQYCVGWLTTSTNATSAGNAADYITASSQAFTTAVLKEHTDDYWNIFYQNTCGDEWFDSVLSSAAAETTTYSGPPLEYTVYGPGADSCVESNIAYTGATSSLVTMEEGTLCETDVINDANDTTTMIFSKIKKAECLADKVSYNVYNCMDMFCKDCSPDAEVSGYVPTPAILDALEDPKYCFGWLTTSENSTSTGNAAGYITASSQAFTAAVLKDHSDEYWNIFYRNTCGDEWLDGVIDSSACGCSVFRTVAIVALVTVFGW